MRFVPCVKSWSGGLIVSGCGANLVVLMTAVLVLTMYAFEFSNTWKMAASAESNYSLFAAGALI